MKVTSVSIATVSLLLSALLAAAAENQPPLRVVPSVDLSRYAGLWYEIARLPNRFQKNCAGDVTAHYTLRTDGNVDVLNKCRIQDGTFIDAKGIAKRADKKKPNSMLKVRFAPAILSFIPQVWGDYQILTLSAGYRHAVVGAPSRDYLWILSRSPEMDSETYRTLLEEAKQQGFNVNQVQRTQQGSD